MLQLQEAAPWSRDRGAVISHTRMVEGCAKRRLMRPRTAPAVYAYVLESDGK